ncbi:MAG: questin oxidase family protein [Piscinibacter sp.]|nr:questin oxidase family protein [Piscinibacter sp.]
MGDAVLHELLDTGLRYAPEYRGGLSNHLPMALCALHALGAGSDRLREFFDRYTLRLSLGPAPGRVQDDWQARLGQADAYADLFASFSARIDAEGRDATLRAVLPVLMEGVGAAAFHGLIRTAYAVEAGHDGELAAGLAYWGSRHLPLEAPSAAGVPVADVSAWLAALAADLVDVRIEGGLIFEQMRAVARLPAFARHAGALTIDAGTLPALADLAAQRYAATRHFTVLHLVTSCHALRLLLPCLATPAARDGALRSYARAYAAGVVASGIQLQGAPLPAPPLGWPEIAARACRSNDDHVIKLVHSARAEAEVYGDGARRHAAALAVAA